MDERVSRAKTTERLLAREGGATMRDIIAATGGPQYNELKRLAARGYTIRKVKEGNETRYFASAPQAPSFEASVTDKGQVTIPKEIRDRLGVHAGGKLRFSVEEGRVTVAVPRSSLADLVGILPKPKRRVTIEDMNEGIKQAAVDRFLRAVGKKK
jgi:AbrB family looped-hinge helix DNA binding protein